MHLGKSAFVMLFVVSTSTAFRIVDYQPKSPTVLQYGDKLKISCTVDNWWEWCKIVHTSTNRICDYEWQKKPYNVTVKDCSNFGDRMRYAGDYENYNCAVELDNVTPDDAGEWRCEIEQYYAGRHRGYGYNATGTIRIDIPTTTTTTTTTTLPPTTQSTANGKDEEDLILPEYDVGKGTPNAEIGSTAEHEQTPDETEDPSNPAGYIVIVVIIIILIAAAILLFGLHYKKKLPESFYNLGGLIKGDKGFTPVLEKDTDEDLKNHPTIVKNGASNGTNNGTMSENATTELGTMETESANINPELAKVTWTSENKTDADTHLDSEQKPLKEQSADIE